MITVFKPRFILAVIGLVGFCLSHAGLAWANEESLKTAYIDFETAYLSNDAEGFAPWLKESYALKQTMHIPGLGSDSRSQTGEELLQQMRGSKNPNFTARSELEGVKVLSDEDGNFCGSSETLTKVNIEGHDYTEREVRKVCFEPQGDSYKATLHMIDIYYFKL